MAATSKYKAKRFIVYIKEFDKFNENNEPLCRNLNCTNKVCKPYRKYCSKKCSKEFSSSDKDLLECA